MPKLAADWDKIGALKLPSDGVSTTVGMAQIIEGKPSVDKMSDIDLYEMNKEIRLQRIVFLASKDVYDTMSHDWKGSRELLLIQIVKLVEEFIRSDRINVTDVSDDELRTKITILFNMGKVVAHVYKGIRDSSIRGRFI